jgi:pretoxin HINT domain-containing protein
MRRVENAGLIRLVALAGFAVVVIVGTQRESAAEGNNRSASSDTLVEMAYAAEVSGQSAVRDALVEKVLSKDPDNERARWLTGQVRNETGWLRAGSSETDRSDDKLLREYVQKRESCGEDAQSRLRLANWCRDHDMPDREKVHLTELVAWHGGNPALMTRLGMVKFQGQWIPEQNLDEFRRLDDRQRRVEKKWKPVFAEWKDDLKADDAVAYEKLAERLAEVTDGEALPILEEMLSTHSEKAALAVVGCLDMLAMQEATESLVRHAVFSEFEAVRVAAAAALKKRPKYNYMPMLIAGLVDPLEVEVEYPFGNVGYRRKTAIQRGADYDVKTVSHESNYVTRAVVHERWRVRWLGRFLPISRNPRSWPATWRTMSTNDDWSINVKPGRYVEKETARTRFNDRICESLYLLSGESYSSPEEWRAWWKDYTEYERDGEKPTYEHHVHKHFWAYLLRFDIGATSASCLAWGTSVSTETGSRPVEQILPGDKVLAQDSDTGQLEYKVVLQRTVRRLGEMRKVSIGDDSITVTLGHPFWVVGKGWRMAKELEIGQRVRGLDASCEITAIEKLPEDVAYNLVVDDFATYFASDSRLLLHDNTLPEPTDAILPGFVAGGR